jgi:phosphoenolpyruvate-protein kinase (PTS system EI component)
MLFLGREQPMPEDEQVAVYAAACGAMAPHPVVVRCLDVGSDKAFAYLPPSRPEPNPALGRRGLRLWLLHEELSGPQARALVRVAREYANLEVMFPMVGAPEEMALARASLDMAAKSTGGRVPRLGMMVELPSAALALDAFHPLIEFISLGTNDLTQYSLGIDRQLDWEPYLTEFSPGVLRIIETAVHRARELGIESAVCGEMAGSGEGAVFLAGVGVDALSMAPAAIPAVLEVLIKLGAPTCALAAKAALQASDATSAKNALTRAIEAGSASS